MTLDEARAVASQAYPKLCRPDEALRLAEFMGKAMPTGAGTDFEIWLKDAAIIFGEYPEIDVRTAVEHPVKGFRAKHKWLPGPSEMIEFLNKMRERRGRIVANALYVIEEHKRLPEPEADPVEREASARRVQNIIRQWHGQPSLEQEENRREEQKLFNAQCIEAGNGDYLRGLNILLGLESAA